MADRPRTSSSLTTKARRKLAAIAEAAGTEALKCRRVLTKLDLRRAAQCEALVLRAHAISEAMASWHHPDTPKARQVGDAEEFQSVVREATRLGLDIGEPR
jgi:hypothetical protein